MTAHRLETDCTPRRVQDQIHMWLHHMTGVETLKETETEAENVGEIVQETSTAIEVREGGHPTEIFVVIEDLLHAGMFT